MPSQNPSHEFQSQLPLEHGHATPLASEMITKIRRNRISTTQVSDCLGKTGVLSEVSALNRGFHRVGPVFWTYACNESNWEFHEQVSAAPAGSIVLTETWNCAQRAVFGSLVSKYLILYREVLALVMVGPVRDAPHIIKENWPVWCSGVTPIGCFNRRNDELPPVEWIAARRKAFDGAIAVCDDSGVVIIPPEDVTPRMSQALDDIEALEDIWFDCIDRRKWTTFEVVCLKRYLDENRSQEPPREKPP